MSNELCYNGSNFGTSRVMTGSSLRISSHWPFNDIISAAYVMRMSSNDIIT
jgi:hypothetical protein